MTHVRLTAVAVLLCMVAIIAVAATAFAGEITGNGTRKAVNGASICAFSGQNDEYHEVSTEWPRVQSFGQDVKVSVHAGEGPLGGVPGQACRGVPPTR
jgi:hypothetical protein